MTAHQMVVLGQDRDGLIEAECIEPECGRHIIVGRSTFMVLAQGDFYARHSFSTGLDINLQVDIG